MIKAIKILHTFVWFVMAFSVLLVIYLGFARLYSAEFWIATGLLVLESLILSVNNWICPMTKLAEKFTDDRSHNFDIYLPNLFTKWLKENNKLLFKGLFALGIILFVYGLI